MRDFFSKRQERELLTIFDYGLFLKILGGLSDVVASVLVLVVPPHLVLRVAEIATQGELASDPHDLVGNLIRASAHAFVLEGHFLLAVFLFVHGAVKATLATLVFLQKRWAYPAFMAVLVVFASYEIYRGVVRHDFLLGSFALFDLILFGITVHEYRRVKNSPQAPVSTQEATV